MKTCETLRDDLKAYIDRELPLPMRLSMTRHLAHCAACRKEIAEMEQIAETIRASDDAPLSVELRGRLMSVAAAASPAAPEPVGEKGDHRLPFWKAKPLATWGVVATLAVAWFIVAPVFTTARYKVRVAPSPAPRVAALPDNTSPGRWNKSNIRPAEPSGFNPYFDPDNPPSALPGPAAKRSVESDQVYRPYGTQNGTASVERQVHREAEITVAVKQVEAKTEAVEDLVQAAGGFVASSEMSTGEDNLRSATLTVRVPVKEFDSVLKQIGRLGEVRAKSVSGEDITEKISDVTQETHVLQNEIKYKEQRLKQRGWGRNSLGEEEAARNLRVELAQARARLDIMKKMAALATIGVQLEEKKETQPQTGGVTDQINETGRMAFSAFLQSSRVIVTGLIWIVAYAPLWVPLAIGLRYARKAQRARSAG